MLLLVVFRRASLWHLRACPKLKVRGLSPQLLAHPPAQGEWGGRLREGIRERGKR